MIEPAAIFLRPVWPLMMKSINFLRKTIHFKFEHAANKIIDYRRIFFKRFDHFFMRKISPTFTILHNRLAMALRKIGH